MESLGESEIDPSVGLIFCPTNEEIIIILKYKRSHPDFCVNAILESNVYDYEPSMLREAGDIHSDGKWYFLCARDPLSGGRFSRCTKTGHWKSTGKSRPIKATGTNEEIGTKRTLVFQKRVPGQENTNWVMHEYSDSNNPQDLVVYRIHENKDKKKKEKKEKKRCISTKNENKPAKKRRVSANDVSRPELPRSDSVENTFPEGHHYSVCNFNTHDIDATLQVDPLLPQNLNVLNDFMWLDQDFFSMLSPIISEEGASSSSVCSNENEVLNSSFSRESPGNEFLGDETVHTRGFCGGDSSDVMSTENFNAWVNELFWNNASGACQNYI